MIQQLAGAPRAFATITIDIDPVLLRIGHIHIGWYGLALALAVLVGILVSRREARRRGLDPDAVFLGAGWAIVRREDARLVHSGKRPAPDLLTDRGH